MNQLDQLAQHRDAILLAEIGAWLHMLGKFHEDFLQGNHDLDIQIPPDLTANYPMLNVLLRDPWPGPLWEQMGITEFNAANLSFFNLAKDHRNRQASEGLVRLIWDAHGRGSGIEKGVLERFAPGQQTTVYPATALGRELNAVDLDQLHTRRRHFYAVLEQWLQQLRQAQARVDWATLRRDFIQRLEQDFRITVAETRRPMNDVTMFDQTAASVAIFKAALAQNLLVGWQEPVQQSVANKYKWRILRVGINGPTFWGSAARLSDLLSRRELIVLALDQAGALLEEVYPLGVEVYRDENGSMFIMPDIPDLLDLTADNGSLREQLLNIGKDVFAAEATFSLKLSDPTRNILTLGRLATADLPAPASLPQWLQPVWNREKPREVCPVCGLRPQGPSKKAAERNVCDVCEGRRSDRSKLWVTDLITTIWADEVADKNGRLALIVGHFGVDVWLTGEAFSTVLMFDPARRQLTDPGRGEKQYEFNYAQLLQDLEEAFRRKQFKGNTLFDDLVLPVARGGSFSQFYDIQVTDSDLSEGCIPPGTTLLALAMLRQNPSFARIRRVWETTRAFWQDVQVGLSSSVGVVNHRLAIFPTAPGSLDLGLFHTYELALNGVRLSVVWDSDNKRFITCDNLAYLAKSDQLGREVVKVVQSGRTFALEEPAGYGGVNRKLGTVAVERVEPLAESYTPAIPILAQPRTFMALVPADKALEVVSAIRTKYEREMGKVRNRLPLHLGIVYFQRRTPLRSALDAGRRMLKYEGRKTQDNIWTVKRDAQTGPLPGDKAHLAQGTQHFTQTISVELEQNGRSFTWHVPAVMGDGVTPDNWYPYVFIQNDVSDRQCIFKAPRPKSNGETEECWLIHAVGLKAGDQVYFTPATLDFQWLDSAGQRFEIAYDEQGRRRNHPIRPYLLDELAVIEQAWRLISGEDGLTSNQIYALRDLIETKRESWRPTVEVCRKDGMFWRFCHDVVVNANWKTEPATEQIDRLTDWAVSGLLTDVIQLYMGIMKCKPHREEKEND